MARVSAAFLALLVMGVSARTVLSDDAASAPSSEPSAFDAAIKEARKTVYELFKSDIAKAKRAEDKAALARKLLQTSAETRSDPASRVVLLELARDMAAQGGDVDTALVAIAELEDYELDSPRIHLDALGTLSLSRQAADLAGRFDDLIERAVREDQYDVAKQLAGLNVKCAKATRNADSIKEASARVRDITEMEAAFGQVKKTSATLASDSIDPTANLTAGKFYCFLKNDWPKGTPMLAMGSDADLKKLATKELSKPTEAEKQVELADGWWALGQKQTGVAKRRLTEHAASWYEKALPGLKGMAKVKIEHKLETIYDALAPNLGDLAAKPDDWCVGCWQGRWNAFPLSKMQVKRAGDRLIVRNTTGIHSFALLRQKQVLDGDFAVTFEYRGSAEAVLLYDKNGTDAAIGIGSLKKSSSWCQVKMCRKNGKWQRSVAGMPVTVPIDSAKAMMTGYFSINLLSGQEVEIRRCVVKTGEAARR